MEHQLDATITVLLMLMFHITLPTLMMHGQTQIK
jgi:hypothetical protein